MIKPLLKTLSATFLSGILLYPTLSLASGLDVVEIVNFQCPHCRHFEAYVPNFSGMVRAQGGIYRMAPIEPSVNGEPDVSVRFWYALDDLSGDKVADKAAKYLYLGYQKGATLNSVAGIYSWLQDYMTGLPSISELRKVTYGQKVLHQWTLALTYTKLFPTTKVPEFVFIDPEKYSVVYKLQRDKNLGNADLLYKELKKELKRKDKYTAEPQLTKLPWVTDGSIRK